MRCLNCHRDDIGVQTLTCPRCGVHLPTLLRDTLASGTQLCEGRYQIDYPLGQGGFGITYRALDLQLNQPVAIKELYPKNYGQRDANGNLTIIGTANTAYKKWLQRFEREGQILTRLTHPGIVKVFAVLKERNTAYWVMELLQGWTLAEELNVQPQKCLSEQRVAEVMTALVSALDTLHRDGIYHLDLKPDNVFMTQDGRIVLVDFGAARQELGGMTSSQNKHATPYSPEYAPPELLAGGPVSAATDLFELGMLLHEMLTGQRPPAVLNRLGQDIWEPPTLNQPWRGMVTEALRLQWQNRPQQVNQWWQTYAQQHPPQLQNLNTTAEHNPELRQQIQTVIATAKQERIPPQPTAGTIRELGPVIGGQNLQVPAANATPPKPATSRLKPLFIILGSLFAFLVVVSGAAIIFVHSQQSNSNTSETANESNDPKQAKFYFDRANEKSRVGDHKDALEDFNLAIRLNPKNSDAHYRRGQTKVELGDKKGALKDYNEAIRLKPDSAHAYLARGKVKRDLEDEKGALADYDQAIRLNPKLVEAYDARAFLKYVKGDYKAALADFNQALRRDPNYSYAYYGRAGVKSKMGDTQGALADYNETLRLNPNFAYAYVSRGQIKLDLGDTQGAMADFNQALRFNPKESAAYAGLGRLKLDLGDKQGAMADYNQAIRLEPTASNYVGRGFARYRLKDLQGAIADYQQALALDSKYGTAKSNIGFARYDLGKLNDAVKSWQDALALDKEDPDPRMALATALYRMGRKEQALIEAETALKNDIRFAQADILKKEYFWSDLILADFKPLRDDPKFQAIVRRLQSQKPQQN